MSTRTLIITVIFLLAGAGLRAQPVCDTSVTRIDTAEFRAMLALHDGILIDVRKPEEYKMGFIKGAINIDYLAPDFKEQIAKLDKSKTYYVYCEVGGRSTQAAQYMKAETFCKVITLARGFRMWKLAGYPVEMPPAAKPKKTAKGR
jgi:rhodanese-related sulfurtransferase